MSKRLGSPYVSGRTPDWLKMKNANAPAVKREAEEDWGQTTCTHFASRVERWGEKIGRPNETGGQGSDV